MSKTVEYIQYNGEKYPFRVGYYAIKKLQAEGRSLKDIDKGDMTVYEPLLYYSLEQGHRLDGKDFTFKMEDMEIVLDVCFDQFVPRIPDFFQGLEGMEETAAQKQRKQATANRRKKK